MMRPALRPMIIGISMLAAALLAAAMWPSRKIADSAPRIDLERMVPLEFGDWKLDRTVVPVGISPAVRAVLDKIYNQTLERTYVDVSGRRLMLSIAYGGDQRGETSQVHRPEFCYTAQGFQLRSDSVSQFATGFGFVAVKRLVAVQGWRNEPITYWITVGDRATLPGLGRKLEQLRYGLTGRIPDGMLVRVSSIGSDATREYSAQDAFVRDLLAALPERDRVRFLGAIVPQRRS